MSGQHQQTTQQAAKAGADFDVAVVGAGFAGLYMLYRLRRMGLSVTVLEAGHDVGGTWYWNRYPGARCDIESMQYSYQFSDRLQQEWVWTERYATQPEILSYANHVADRFDLRRDIRFDTPVAAASFDEEHGCWILELGDGEPVSARHCVMATGCLSSPNMPTIAGLGSFQGDTYHTGHWPHRAVDFSGQRVGIIGTGSSAIQSIPLIAAQAKHLTVFQRTPNYSIPAHNAPLKPGYVAAIKADYAGLRARAKRTPPGIDAIFNLASAMDDGAEQRRGVYEKRWAAGGLVFMAAYADLMVNKESNDTAAEFARSKIREIVDDPALAERLSPGNIIGGKRLCVDSGYYATYNRPNVRLVNLHERPIEAITPAGIRLSDQDIDLDVLIYATGFDAMTGALLKIDIRGRGGQRLSDKWAAGPRTYLGLTMAGFPNLFTITGPGSPSVLTNMLPSIEQHVDWVADCLDYLRENGQAVIEAQQAAEDDWVAQNAAFAEASLRSTTDSWYDGANIAGKPRVFMPFIGGFPLYVKKCAAVAANGYEGFALSG